MLHVTFLNDPERYTLSLGAVAAKIIEILATAPLSIYKGDWQKFQVIIDERLTYMRVTRKRVLLFSEIRHAVRENGTTELGQVFPRDSLDRLRRLAHERPIPPISSNRFSRHEALIRAVQWLIERQVEVDLSNPESITATCLALEAELDGSGNYEETFAALAG